MEKFKVTEEFARLVHSLVRKHRLEPSQSYDGLNGGQEAYLKAVIDAAIAIYLRTNKPDRHTVEIQRATLEAEGQMQYCFLIAAFRESKPVLRRLIQSEHDLRQFCEGLQMAFELMGDELPEIIVPPKAEVRARAEIKFFPDSKLGSGKAN